MKKSARGQENSLINWKSLTRPKERLHYSGLEDRPTAHKSMRDMRLNVALENLSIEHTKQKSV